MAHSSLPIFLDHPNWQQQSNQPLPAPANDDHEEPRQVPGFLPPAAAAHGGGGGCIRPGSMAYRARLAMIPQPEAALKCPRCDSTNTKFCYFNNYSLSQPRHFCKTCRRYWTRGGALRNVPVGGGFRKNKKKKKSSNRSKSPTATQTQMGNSRGSGGAIISNIESTAMGHNFPLQQHLSRFGGPGNSSGLNFNGIHLNSGRQDHQLDPWHSHSHQQLPFVVAGLEPPPPPAGYPLNIIQTQVNNFGPNSSSAAAALQYCHQQLQNLTPFSRNPLKNEEQIQNQNQDDEQEQGIISNFLRPDHHHQIQNNQFWGDHQNPWTDHLSALSSSSSTHLL